jgi:uncharacterized HhH-GPD family protein
VSPGQFRQTHEQSSRVLESASQAAPQRLHYTDSDEANALLASDPMALLIGFALDQQVTVQTAFAGPLKIKERLGTLDPGALAALDPTELEAAFRERPAVHRFPGSMASKVAALCAHVEAEYGGDASRLWREAGDSDELRRRIEALPGFGRMKVTALGSVLAKRFGVEAAQGLAPSHPTLGDVDSREALERYQEAKRAHKAKLRAQQS